MKKKSLFRIISCIFVIGLALGALFFSAKPVSAKSCADVDTAILECEPEQSGIGHILKTVLDILSVGVVIIAVLSITIAGIQYLTAGDKEEQARTSKRRISEIIIGVAIYVLIYALLQWLLPGSLNPDDIPYYKAPEKTVVTYEDYDGTSTESSTGKKKSSSFTETKQCTSKTDRKFIVDKNGKIEGYFINIPKGATSETPIILYLSGDRETTAYSDAKERLAGSSIIKSTEYMFNSNDFISIIPLGPGTKNGGWASQSKELAGLVTGEWGQAKTLLSSCGGVKSRKKYILGLSNGAGGTWVTVNNYPSLFKAAAPIAGSTFGNTISASNFSHTKIVAVSDTNYNSAMRGLVKDIKTSTNTSPILVQYNKDHEHITASINYDALFSCLLKNSCSNFGQDATIYYGD